MKGLSATVVRRICGALFAIAAIGYLVAFITIHTRSYGYIQGVPYNMSLVGYGYFVKLIVLAIFAVVIFLNKNDKALVIVSGLYVFATLFSVVLVPFMEGGDLIKYMGEYLLKMATPFILYIGAMFMFLGVFLREKIANKTSIKYPKWMFIAALVLCIIGGLFSASLLETLAVAAFIFMMNLRHEIIEKTQNGEESAWITQIGLGSHILFTILTLGVWQCVWIYQVSKYENRVTELNARNPVAELLLTMFIPFYSIYWYYCSAVRIDKLYEQKGKVSSIATLCVVMAIFFPIVSLIVIQSKLVEYGYMEYEKVDVVEQYTI